MGDLKKGLLLSGGIDSISLLYGIKPDIAYTIDYGQLPAEREIYVSELVCSYLNIKHTIIKVDCSNLGSGSLVNSEKNRFSPSEEWWPYRNQLIITLALMQGIKDDVNELHLASVKSDGFHKDGTIDFYSLINNLTQYQEGNISVKCETLNYFSHELVNLYKVPLDYILLAHSCHKSNIACGKCTGCQKNLRVRQELSIE
jgi:7-cyano-7-deazaguanine synthase